MDEAHHAFGKQLAEDMGTDNNRTSLRLTIDELATSLKRAGSHVVACFNYTGTPYVQNRILPEVVYAFGLSEAINTIRSYYPDFLLQKDDGQYFIVEVKANYQIDAPVVVAKRTFAEKTATASNMTYFLLKASDAQKGSYEMIWQAASREKYLREIMQQDLK